MAAAPLAHGGLCADRHLQIGAALETRDLPDLPRAFLGAGGRFEDFLNADILAALFAGRGDGGARFRLLVTATRAGHQDLSLFLRWHSKLSRAAGRLAAQRPTILAGSGILGTSLVRGGGAVGETLFGLTSVFPTNVTPSSIASLAERMSPNNSVFALISIFSLAVMLPLILPRTTTLVALILPLTTAPSPRFRVPSVWISPSSLPSKVNSPANFRLPLISTSEFNTFFDALPVVLICSPSVFVVKLQV